MIRNFGATGITSQPAGLDLGVGGGSNIKSIQRGSATIGAGLTYLDVTISNVDSTKTVVILNSDITSGALSQTLVRGVLTSNTNLRLSVGGTTSAINVVQWQIIEFQNIKSSQQGTSVASASTSDILTTISSVNMAKSILFFTCDSANTTASTFVNSLISLSISTPTTLAYHNPDSYTKNVSWYVVEFY